MAEQEFVVSFKELKKVEVLCSKCGSSIIFSFTPEIVVGGDERFEGKHHARACPSCSKFFGSAILGALKKWHDLVSAAEKEGADFQLQFHVPLAQRLATAEPN